LPLRVSVIEAGNGTSLLEAEAVAGGVAKVPVPEVIDMLIRALDDPMYRYKPSGCLGSILLLGILLGVALYWFA
jgi:hypothetical protein